ncbi:MAG: tetratricopeptide repeat protein [Thalassobaculum sp.]|uniref:GT-D fold domain-containing protein n=1 Tax=Thalassobaculum sp. TaxID=2022740 RepID=UPI0032EFA4C3
MTTGGNPVAWTTLLQQATARLQVEPDDMPARVMRAGALLHLDRLDEAEASFRELDRVRPIQPFGPEGLAQVADRRGDRVAALRLWRRVLTGFPAHAPAWLGLGTLQLVVGQFDGAGGSYARVGALAPASPLGAVGAAETAAHARDWDAALERWLGILRRWPGIPKAVIGAVTALANLGRLDEAEALLAGQGDALPAPDAVFAKALILQKRQRYAEIASLLDRNAATVPGHPMLRLMRFHAATVRGRPEDAARALAPAGGGPLPPWARAMTAAHACAGGSAEACGELRALWHEHGEALFTPDLIGVLAQSLGEAEGRGAVERLLASLEALHPFSIRAIKLRLFAVLERLRWQETCRPGADGEAIRGLAAAFDPQLPFGHAARWLARLADRFDALRRCHAAFPIDTAWRREAAAAVVDRILDHCAEKRPFSLIRLGDGEGNFLPYPPAWARFEEADRRSVQYLWWGERRLGPADEAEISSLLCDSIRHADIVGVPDLSRLCFGMPLPAPASLYQSWHDYRGVLAILDHLDGGTAVGAGTLIRPEQVITSCNLHVDLASWGLYERLFGSIRRVSVIGCHAALPAELAARFGLTVSRFVRIPHERKFGEAFGYGDDGDHYPDAFRRLRRDLVAEPGEVFLVAAGILGKIYCDWIRSAGGIALDIGSVVDHWCGFSTRTLRLAPRR